MRRPASILTSVLLGAGIVLTAAGCSGSPTPSPTSTTSAPTPTAAADVDLCATTAGPQVQQVSVSGPMGAAPTVTFANGLSTDTTERAVVVQGEGPQLPDGGTAHISYVVYNAATGKQLESYGYATGEDTVLTASPSSGLLGFAKAIACENVGSRIAAVIPPSDAFGDQGNSNVGVGGSDSLVLVVDIGAIVPNSAWGQPQTPTPSPDMPTVALGADGTPSITIPAGAKPPTQLQTQLLKKGDGPVVKEGATVVVQYLGVQWDTGQVFDQSWGKGLATLPLNQVVDGFSKALVGQTVGSQVLAVLPPSEAYGDQPSDSNPLAGKTLVFVIDIVDVLATSTS